MAERLEPEENNDESKIEEDVINAMEAIELEDEPPEQERHVRFQDDLPKQQRKQWFLRREDIEVLKQIGEGSFGMVFLGKWLNSEVAVKQLFTKEKKQKTTNNPSRASTSSTPLSWSSPTPSVGNTTAIVLAEKQIRQLFKHETSVWFSLSYHPHIVRLFGACDEGLPLTFVCEYAKNESLDKYLSKHPGELWQKMYELALGVQYLHERDIVHGDLKLNNIVVGGDLKAKVTDFGLSVAVRQKFSDGDLHISEAAHWLAPECMGKSRQPPTRMSDVYSLGMCIVEGLKIVNRCECSYPWDRLGSLAIKVHKDRGHFPALQQGWCTRDQLFLMKKMCKCKPSERITIDAVVYALESFADMHEPLDQYLRKHPDELWQKLYELALEVKYLHERDIVHGDLRLSSVMVGGDLQAKLTDFGLSVVVRDQATNDSVSKQGVFSCLVPECKEKIIEREFPTMMSDVYSLGACIIEGLKIVNRCENPRGDRDSTSNQILAENSEISKLLEKACTPEQYSLVKKMCNPKPDERLSISDVVDALESFAMYPMPERTKTSSGWEEVQKQLSKLRIQFSADDARRAMVDRIGTLMDIFNQETPPTRLILMLSALIEDIQQAKDSDFLQYKIVNIWSRDAEASSVRALNRRLSNIESIAKAFYGADDAPEAIPRSFYRAQVDLLVSDNPPYWVLQTEPESDEERSGFLKFLLNEIESRQSRGSSSSQLAVLRNAYSTLSQSPAIDLLPSKPRWFIPLYELQMSQNEIRNEYGVVRVSLARWFDVAVSVRELMIFKARDYEFSYDFSDEESDDDNESREGILFDREVLARTLEKFNHVADKWFNLTHPHIVQLYGGCNVGNPFFVTEHTNGALNDYLRFHPEEIWSKLLEVALGVEYLHSVGVVHGDIQCKNVEIGTDQKAKLTDFGLRDMSKGINSERTPSAEQWMAPEYLEGEATSASDVYSLGMTIVEAMRIVENVMSSDENHGSGFGLPWGGLPDVAIRVYRKRGELPDRPTTSTNNQWILVKSMCANEPSRRLSASEVVTQLNEIVRQPA